MTVNVCCPRCGCEFQRPRSVVGKVLACPDCGRQLCVAVPKAQAAEQPSGWDFERLVKAKMAWLTRLSFREEIKAAREACQRAANGLAREIVFGDAGVLDIERRHIADMEGQALWVITEAGLITAVGPLDDVLSYADIKACAWHESELHLLIDDPAGEADLGASGLWLKPLGTVSPAWEKGLQALLEGLIATGRDALTLPEWAQAMPDFLRPDPPKIEQLEALREECGYPHDIFQFRIMSSPATTRRSMRWRYDLIRSRRPDMPEREALNLSLLDRLIYTSGITGAAFFAEGLESCVPESVKRHFKPPGDEEEVWGKVSLLTPDEVEQSMRYVETLDDASELVIAIETLAKVSDYNGMGHRIEGILGEVRPNGQCQEHDRCPPALPWISELLDQWRLHEREAYARERALLGVFAWTMFMESLEDGPELLEALKNQTGFPDDFLSRAVEELFMLDNIDPLKWLANWRALEMGLSSDFMPDESPVHRTPSVGSFLSFVHRPLGIPVAVLAAYPDVLAWLNDARSEETAAGTQENERGLTPLGEAIFGDLDEGAFEGLSEQEGKQETLLAGERRIVDYYRKHVNRQLECEP